MPSRRASANRKRGTGLRRLVAAAAVAVLVAIPVTGSAQPDPALFELLDFFQALYASEPGIADPAGDLTTRSGDETANPLPHTDVLAAWAFLFTITDAADAEALVQALIATAAAPSETGPLVGVPSGDEAPPQLDAGRELLLVGATLAAEPPRPLARFNLSYSWTRPGQPVYAGADVDNHGFNASVYGYFDGERLVTGSYRYDGAFNLTPTEAFVIVDGQMAYLVVPVEEIGEADNTQLTVGASAPGSDSSYDTVEVPVASGPAHPFPPVDEPVSTAPTEGEPETPSPQPTSVAGAPTTAAGPGFPIGLAAGVAGAVVAAGAGVMLAARRRGTKGPCDPILARIAEIDAFVANLHERYAREVADGNEQGADYCVRSAASNLATREELVAQLAAHDCPPAGPPPVAPEGFPAAAVGTTTEAPAGAGTSTVVDTGPSIGLAPPDHGPTAERGCKDGDREEEVLATLQKAIPVAVEVAVVAAGYRKIGESEEIARQLAVLEEALSTVGDALGAKSIHAAARDGRMTEAVGEAVGAALSVPTNPASAAVKVLEMTAGLGGTAAQVAKVINQLNEEYSVEGRVENVQADLQWVKVRQCAKGEWQCHNELRGSVSPSRAETASWGPYVRRLSGNRKEGPEFKAEQFLASRQPKVEAGRKELQDFLTSHDDGPCPC